MSSDIADNPAWQSFVAQEKLTATQQEQFATYLNLIRAWNEVTNLTTITTVEGIVRYHFQDSLQLRNFVPLQGTENLCDVGSGAGFPGIPLKIMYPASHVVLLEVNHKKEAFLHEVIEHLGLTDIEVCTVDWRNFLRKPPYERIDYFIARASLQPDELLRVFKPSCPFNGARLVYWAARDWMPRAQQVRSLVRQEVYTVGNKKRKLVEFQKESSNLNP
jgi:16S rRNA (guanine527-N7)-methyltransferase